MRLVTLQDPRPDVRLAESVAAHRHGLVAEAIRQMAHELHEYDRVRAAGAGEVLDRSREWLENRLGRCPTAGEVAFAAGLSVEIVLDVLEERRQARGDRQF